MRPSRETVMTTLLATLANAVKTSFTANTQAGSGVLLNPSVTKGLFIGLPVFGAGIPAGAVITALSPLTISRNASANATGVSMMTGFSTISRRAKFTADVAQPALFLRAPLSKPGESIEYEGPLEALTMKPEFIISTSAGADPDVVPETALNNLLDAVRSALNPDDMSGRFTLGGLVHWCRIIGDIDKDTGDLGPIAIAAGDIEIIVP